MKLQGVMEKVISVMTLQVLHML